MLGFTTVVSGKNYQEYIPFYIYSILKSYPDYHVKIFCRENLRKNILKSLSILSPLRNFEVIENSFEGYPDTITNNKVCRWIINEEDLSEFDYVYIGDIDFFILPEVPTFLEQHLIHCETLGMPFSNMVRPFGSSHVTLPPEDQDRLTGLHFIKRGEYYKKMNPIISEYREIVKDVMEGSDERILFKMVEKAFGNIKKADLRDTHIQSGHRSCITIYKEDFILGLPYWRPEEILFRPYHGIHYGAFRLKDRKLKISAKVNKFYYGRQYFKFMKDVKKDPLYKNILKNSSYKVRRFINTIDTYLHLNEGGLIDGE